MKSDAEIERERAALEPLIGPTRASWYAEACQMEIGREDADVLRWGCRYREMAREGGLLVEIIKDLVAACQYAAGSFAQVPEDKTVPPIVLHDCKRKLDEAAAKAKESVEL